jgi:uncharacterized protein
MADPIVHHVLFYDYVTENVLERRAPYRAEHLELVRRWKEDGRLVMAGALGDPPTGGLLAFKVDDPAEIDEFVNADPYVSSGLVTSHRVERWTVV